MNELMPLSDVQSRLREKVRAAMLDLIPPEAFDAFVKQEWERFTKDVSELRGSYDGRVTQSAQKAEISTLIEIEIRKRVQEIIKVWGDEWVKGHEAHDLAKAVFVEASKVAAQTYLESTAGQIARSALWPLLHQSGATACVGCRTIVARGANCPRCNMWNPS